MNVLLRSKARIDRRRKQTEIDLKNEKLRVLEKISQKLESGDAAREEKEQAILQKAIEEKEAINEARRQADIRKQEAFKQQRVADRQQFLRDEEQRLREFNTMRQWEIMNRFKNAEIHNEFKENFKERSDREAQERADTRYFYGELAERKLRDADNKLLTHANKLLEEAAKHGRPDFALHKAIDVRTMFFSAV
ncbi:stress response protein NST1-like [Manduca sexta]|uniref:stress response protein NST1-like n=1 Tax=Manduca sexta TaxID=7130 RepID=UPI00189058B2|nr:stress response protein NST1-like [Manduca sexta]